MQQRAIRVVLGIGDGRRDHVVDHALHRPPAMHDAQHVAHIELGLVNMALIQRLFDSQPRAAESQVGRRANRKMIVERRERDLDARTISKVQMQRPGTCLLYTSRCV